MEKQERSIFLRMFEEDDYILINQWRNDPSQTQLMHSPFRYVSLELEREWVRQKMMENTKEIYLAICLNDESRRMIGFCSINNVDYLNRSAEVGALWIGDKSERKAQHIYEVLDEVGKYAFFTYNLERVYTKCLVEQDATYTFAMAMGSQIEGRMRNSVLKGGKYFDEYLLSILRSEYLTLFEKGYYDLSKFVARTRQIADLQQEGLSADEIWHALHDPYLCND